MTAVTTNFVIAFKFKLLSYKVQFDLPVESVKRLPESSIGLDDLPQGLELVKSEQLQES
jgi:hypothetical protein